MKAKPIVVLLVLATALQPLCAQGPITGFMPSRGQLTLASSYGEEHFDAYFDQTGSTREEVLDLSFFSQFIEYGLSDSFSLVATLPHLNVDGGQRGWQDAGLWLKFSNMHRYRANDLKEQRFVTALGLSFPASGYLTDTRGSIGRRATTFQGRISWQQSHRQSGWFVQALAGIDFQFIPIAKASFPLLLRVGRGGRWTYFDAWLERYASLDSVTDATLTAGAGSSWTRAGATFYVPVLPFLGLNSGIAYILSGKNIGQSLRWNLGMVVQIQ